MNLKIVKMSKRKGSREINSNGYIDISMTRKMNRIQGNTPPIWLGRSNWSLIFDVIGGFRQNADKIIDVFRMLGAVLRPYVVRRRLERLKRLKHCEVIPSLSQLLVASRDQLSFSLGADTKEFYRAQGIPWTFHNIRRFLGYPTTMMDPLGLFSSHTTIIQHILQTFHRHATYDMVLLHGHEGGLEEMKSQLDQLADGTHPHQRSLKSLVEDGSYHDRLRRDLAEFMENPHIEARAIPEGLVENSHLMLAMDQFKDLRGYTNYASRLNAGPLTVLKAFVQMAFNETLGEFMTLTIGPRTLTVSACDTDLVQHHLESKHKAANPVH